MLITVTILLILEYKFKIVAVYYDNANERFWDVLITFFISSFLLIGTTVLYKLYYNKERDRVTRQNKELFDLNNKSLSQNNRLKQSLIEIEEKNQFINTLMIELNHRVKNNLQLITSLLNMQEAKLNEGVAKQAFNTSKNRLVSVGLIHQNLYNKTDDLNVEVSSYI